MSVQTVYLPFDVALLPVKELRAGRLTCLYEHGNLRYLKVGDEEVLRMMYSAVRDGHWATAMYEIKGEVIEEGDDSFSIRYTAFYELNEIKYKAQIEITGTESQVSFSMQGEALSDFYRNRIGICVLHPIAECAGQKAVIKHPDGSEEEKYFPELISPHQPLKNIRELRWKTPGATATLIFEGDVFETEDQRNWSDCSFKTYSTPLEIPFPVQVKKGERVQQRVLLKIAPTLNVSKKGSHQIKAEEDKIAFPKIGYERAYGSPALTNEDIQFLRQILFDHYRVVLHMRDERWKGELAKAGEEAVKLGVPVELVVFFSSVENELPILAKTLQSTIPVIKSILLLEEKKPVASAKVFRKAYSFLKAAFTQAKIGYGTDGFFAELNRNRLEQGVAFDFVSYSLNPQVHASDTRTLLENLEAQNDTIQTAKSFAAGKEVFVSPVTLKIRDNDEEAFGDEDDRMYTAFGAAWTLLTIKNLSGASSLTFYQAKSPRGVLNENKNPQTTPLYQALKQLKDFEPAWIIASENEKHEVLLENKKCEQIKFVLANE